MRRDDGESAVSSVVGTVLMLAITVAVFTAFSVVALDYVKDRPTPPRSDLALVQGSGSLYLVHRGGEAFSGAGGVLVVNHDNIAEEIELTDPRLAGVGTSWSLGDQVCIQGSAAGCLYAATEPIGGAYLVAGDSLLLETGTRATGERSDLTVSLVSQSPAQAGVGSSVAWTVRASNGGAGPMPRSTLLVNVEVDGVLRATATVTGPIAAGSSATATSTAWTAAGTGTHTLRLTVDPTSLVTESDEANNQATSSFDVAAGVEDPGQPFVDLNGDGLYTPGTDSAVTTGDVTDGAYDAGSGSLVLPDSIGDISASQVSLTAGGDIVIGVELTSTNAPMTISAGGDLTFTDSELASLQNNAEITLTVGGDLSAPGLDVSVNGGFVITASGAVDLSGAHVTITSSNEDFTVTGRSVDLSGATLVNNGNSQNVIVVTATGGAVTASGLNAQSTGDQTYKATGGGINLGSSTLVATGHSLVACLASDTADGLSVAGTLSFTDSNNKLNAQRGSSCGTDADADAYVTPWPASASDSPRSKLE